MRQAEREGGHLWSNFDPLEEQTLNLQVQIWILVVDSYMHAYSKSFFHARLHAARCAFPFHAASSSGGLQILFSRDAPSPK